ncbi:hypothetical protein [Streptomyces sp. SID10815]|uniref:hypothetical protein n=1 Tax=Streptomyces sp. SID10815 TaxID=2706027 RepID=UPI0013C6FA2C|nr:hypothetical protein [Streptomyces sp. SID10815]NEA52005.1 hypothetical protein [Streptomyces sp. SID10815]
MRITTRYACVAAALACCCLPLTACGAERAGAGAAGAGAASTAGAGDTGDTEDSSGTGDPGGTEDADTTSDDQGELPDTTSDDQQDADGSLTDETTDETTDDATDGTTDRTTDETTDETTDDTTDDGRDEGVPTTGPHRWFPMLREFRAYLRTSAPRKSDAAIAAHVTSARTRTLPGGARVVAEVHADYGVWETDELDRAAEVFAHWRRSVYGDHGHVAVLAPAKMTAEKDW